MTDFYLSGLAQKMVCPGNELLTDDKGIPGMYVQKAPRRLNELLASGDDSIHPAFLVNGVEISRLFIGKFQGKAHGERIYSLPGVDPTTSITLDTFETYCRNKGNGHHCITAAEWAFLALCAKKDGKQPKGNNSYGKDVSETAYIAIPTTKDTDGRTGRVATGTGPLTWSDTGDIDGIWDLNGNIWEWVSGIRLVKGELQVIPYNNAAAPEVDTSATSTEWRAINAAATSYDDLFITPDGTGTTAGSIKLDYVSNHWQWQSDAITSQSDTGRSSVFSATTFGTGISDFCKMYLRAMALAPEDGDTDYGSGYFWANNMSDERNALRGGSWTEYAYAGVFAMSSTIPHSYLATNIGSRSAYYD